VSHREFLVLLDNARKAEWLVGAWLSSRNYFVRFPPQRAAPRVEDRLDYADDGDLFIGRTRACERRVEVHGIAISFTSSDDFPFDDFIFSRVDRWEREGPPWRIFVVNEALTHAAIVGPAAWAARAWHLKPCTHKASGQVYLSMACSPALLIFVEL